VRRRPSQPVAARPPGALGETRPLRHRTTDGSSRHLSALLVGCLAVALALVTAGAAAAAPTLSYDDYHDFGEVETQLRAWAERPEVELLDIGTSAGGRTLWVARIAGDGPVDPDQRPAVFVGANIAGFHNAGTEAALDLVAKLLGGDAPNGAELLSARTFYVAPVLDPDAHDALFAEVRVERSGNAMTLDHDRDGFEAEDGFDDLDGDGRITGMRIADPAGGWLPHPEDPRVMIRADGSKGQAGAYRMVSEGRDDDGDGELNEDPATGVAPDRNFAHQFPYPDVDAGPWPSYAPETKAVMDFLLAHRNVALAVVYGPANNLLKKPESLGGGSGDLGTQKFKLPKEAAEFLGFDPEGEYTIDEVWEVAKDLSFVVQNNITKDQLAQFLGAGPATKLADEDMAWLDRFAKDYKKRLEDAGLSNDRPAEQYGKGGFTPWLYYQYGVMALELDVWGVPKPETPKDEAMEDDGELTVDRLESMSADEVIALGEDKIQELLDANGVPSQYNATTVIGALQGGQITPERMAAMIRQSGGGESGGDGGETAGDDPATQRTRDVLAWVDANAPAAVTPWTPVTLPDGTKAEVGGLDPFIEVAPPYAVLEPALGVHTATVLDLASKLARVELLSVEAEDLGGGVARVRAVAGNRGTLPTHTKLDERMHTHLPVRLELVTGDGVELVTGHAAVTSGRLEGSAGTVEGTWLVHATPGAEVTVRVITDNAGTDQKTTTIGKGA